MSESNVFVEGSLKLHLQTDTIGKWTYLLRGVSDQSTSDQRLQGGPRITYPVSPLPERAVLSGRPPVLFQRLGIDWHELGVNLWVA